MKTTLEPDQIYMIFEKAGIPALRIDEFDRGNFAKIRAQLPYQNFMTVGNLLELSYKLNTIEKEENLKVKIIHLDLVHQTLSLNISIPKPKS